MQHWINKNQDFVFITDPTNKMPLTTGCTRISESEYNDFKQVIKGPSFEGKIRRPKKSKEERRAARLARRKKKMEG